MKERKEYKELHDRFVNQARGTGSAWIPRNEDGALPAPGSEPLKLFFDLADEIKRVGRMVSLSRLDDPGELTRTVEQLTREPRL